MTTTCVDFCKKLNFAAYAVPCLPCWFVMLQQGPLLPWLPEHVPLPLSIFKAWFIKQTHIKYSTPILKYF